MRRRAEGLRWRWEATSTPFVHERAGRILSHVGVLETRVHCLGEERRVGGVHAVCTLASERRRGLYRVLMEEVLAHCDERYETIELCTEHPEYYEPFGFRVIPEHRFVLRCDRARGHGAFRPLDLAAPADLDLLDRLLDEREPVSHVLGVREKNVFKFNASAFGPPGLQYCQDLDLLAVMRREGRRLELNDLVARRMPTLADLLDALALPLEKITFHFRPDRLGIEATPEPTRYGGDVFMVRGRFPFGPEPVPELMLPPPARH
jgi:GNAT superfamily N-acetyltransferase